MGMKYSVEELPADQVKIIYQTAPTPAQTYQVELVELKLSPYRVIKMSADKTEVLIQKLSMKQILAELKETSGLIQIPEVEQLVQEYQELPTEMLLVKYEEAVQDYLALARVVDNRSYSSFEVSKISQLIRDKYFGYPKDLGDRPLPDRKKPEVAGKSTRPQARLTINLDELD
jgi:hypothetical protein